MEKQKLKRNLYKVQMLKCGSESAPYVCFIIDSDFHYDRLQALAGVIRSQFSMMDRCLQYLWIWLVAWLTRDCVLTQCIPGRDIVKA